MPRRLIMVATLVVGFLALQLSLVGGGPACAMLAAGGTASALADMSGMAGMPGMAPLTGAATSTDEQASGQGELPRSDQAPCEESTAPATCGTMAPCVAAFMATWTPLPEAAPQVPSQVIAAGVLAPPSPSSPPELPPPRA